MKVSMMVVVVVVVVVVTIVTIKGLPTTQNVSKHY